MSHLIFLILAFLSNSNDLSGNTVQIKIIKNSPKLAIFGISNLLMSTQNVNVARFARNVEWDIFGRFSNTVYLPLWLKVMLLMPNATRRALQMVHVCEIRWMAGVAIRTSDRMADKSLRCWSSRFLHFWCLACGRTRDSIAIAI